MELPTTVREIIAQAIAGGSVHHQYAAQSARLQRGGRSIIEDDPADRRRGHYLARPLVVHRLANQRPDHDAYRAVMVFATRHLGNAATENS
ncbi:hypothetical protein D3C76_833130 [compost metagenome]